MKIKDFLNEGVVKTKSVDLTVEKYIKEGKDEVRELTLYITNSSELYKRRIVPIINNLRKKVAKGNYDPELALKLWKPLADEGAKMYGKEFGDGEKSGLRMFSVADRKQVALELRDEYDEAINE